MKHRPISARLYLLLILVGITTYTLAPFQFAFTSQEVTERARAALDVSATGSVYKVGAHFAAFLVVGILAVLSHRCTLEQHGLGRPAFAAALFCFALEAVQCLTESRHARVSDFGANTAGVVVGLAGAMRWRLISPRQRVFLNRLLRHRAAGQKELGLAILSVILWGGLGLRLGLGSLEMDWDDRYRLTIANEMTGDRPWLGELRYTGIYGRALTPEEVAVAYENVGRPRDAAYASSAALLAAYDFTQGCRAEILPVGLLAAADLAMNLPMGCDTRPNVGIWLTENTLLVSRGPATRLSRAIVASGAFSIEVWMRPLNLTQRGPARIVSISNGIWSRNFTLGQEGADGVFRVRNRLNGANGTREELQARGAVRGSLQHWVATYDHGVSALFRDGNLVGHRYDLREPAVSLRLGSGTGARVLAGVLMVVTLALPLYVALGCLGAGVRHLAAIGGAISSGILPYVVSCMIAGGPPLPEGLVPLAFGFFGAYPLSVMYIRVPESESHA